MISEVDIKEQEDVLATNEVEETEEFDVVFKNLDNEPDNFLLSSSFLFLSYVLNNNIIL